MCGGRCDLVRRRDTETTGSGVESEQKVSVDTLRDTTFCFTEEGRRCFLMKKGFCSS